MSEDPIQDYYDRKREEQHAAWLKWREAVKALEDDSTYENSYRERLAYKKYLDAGNTGD